VGDSFPRTERQRLEQRQAISYTRQPNEGYVLNAASQSGSRLLAQLQAITFAVPVTSKIFPSAAVRRDGGGLCPLDGAVVAEEAKGLAIRVGSFMALSCS